MEFKKKKKTTFVRICNTSNSSHNNIFFIPLPLKFVRVKINSLQTKINYSLL